MHFFRQVKGEEEFLQNTYRLVEHVYVLLLDASETNRKSLKFTTGQMRYISVVDVTEFEHVKNLVKVVQLARLLDEVLDGLLRTLNGLWKLVDVLRLHNGLEVILEQLGEVVLKFRTSEVLDHILPVRRVVVFSQVRLELPGQDLQGSTLADTVCSHETQHVSWSGHRQSVELEAVGRVSMGNLGFQVGREVDDGDGREGAFLWADTASDTERLGDEGKSRGGVNFDTQFATTNDGAGLFALLSTFLRFALVAIDNSDTKNICQYLMLRVCGVLVSDMCSNLPGKSVAHLAEGGGACRNLARKFCGIIFCNRRAVDVEQGTRASLLCCWRRRPITMLVRRGKQQRKTLRLSWSGNAVAGAVKEFSRS